MSTPYDWPSYSSDDEPKVEPKPPDPEPHSPMRYTPYDWPNTGSAKLEPVGASKFETTRITIGKKLATASLVPITSSAVSSDEEDEEESLDEDEPQPKAAWKTSKLPSKKFSVPPLPAEKNPFAAFGSDKDEDADGDHIEAKPFGMKPKPRTKRISRLQKMREERKPTKEDMIKLQNDLAKGEMLEMDKMTPADLASYRKSLPELFIQKIRAEGTKNMSYEECADLLMPVAKKLPHRVLYEAAFPQSVDFSSHVFPTRHDYQHIRSCLLKKRLQENRKNIAPSKHSEVLQAAKTTPERIVRIEKKLKRLEKKMDEMLGILKAKTMVIEV